MTAVVVLGQPRGGTSAVAGELARLGLPYAFEPTGATYEDALLRGVDPDVRVAGLREREAMFGPGPWVHKDPLAIDTLQEWWRGVPGGTRWVVVFRDPWAVAVTEQRQTGAVLTATAGAAVERLGRLVDAAALLPGALVVSYELLLRDPQGTSNRLADHAGVKRRRVGKWLGPGYKDVDGTVVPSPA